MPRVLPSAPSADQATTSALVYGLLSDSRYAYRPRALDDALSQDVLKRYLETLDPGKVFLTAQDVAELHAATRPRSTTRSRAASSSRRYAIFALYQQRVDAAHRHARERCSRASSISAATNAATTTARMRRGRPSDAELDAICGRKSVKNDWLRLKLAGKQPDEIRKTLDKRYAQPALRACTSSTARTCSRPS